MKPHAEEPRISDLIRKLKTTNRQTFDETIAALVERSDQSIEPLLRTLSSPHRHIKSYAALALGKIGDPRLLRPVMQALSDSGRYENSLLNALDHFGEGVRLPLIDLLASDSDTAIRASAATALGMFKETRAADALLRALDDPEKRVRIEVITALGRLQEVRAVDPLLIALNDECAWMRCEAAWALGQIRDGRALDPLMWTLHDPDSFVRDKAAFALGLLGNTRAVDPLMQLLKDDYEGVRGSAASSLGRLGEARAVEPLIAMLQQDTGYGFATSQAAWALGELKDQRAVEPLLQTLTSGKAKFPLDAIQALGKLQDRRAIPALIATLQDANPQVRSYAIRSLVACSQQDERIVEPLIAMLDDTGIWGVSLNISVSGDALRALKLIGTPEARAAIKDWKARQASNQPINSRSPE